MLPQQPTCSRSSLFMQYQQDGGEAADTFTAEEGLGWVQQGADVAAFQLADLSSAITPPHPRTSFLSHAILTESVPVYIQSPTRLKLCAHKLQVARSWHVQHVSALYAASLNSNKSRLNIYRIITTNKKYIYRKKTKQKTATTANLKMRQN